MIRSALTSKDEYYKRDYNPEFVEDPNRTKLPPINEAQRNGDTESEKQRQIDRYTLN